MNASKIPVYFVPGLAAGKEIFKNIKLPEDRYETEVIEWLIPEKGESMAAYAKRMASNVSKPNAILVGVSFGGVVVQEMAAFLSLRKVIIISSVKSETELPSRLKFARKTKAYKLLPTGWMLNADDLTRFAVGPRSKKRLALYQQFLHVRNKQYLDWAIAHMVNWKRTEIDEEVVHIHGDEDLIFPFKNILNKEDCFVLEGGTHIMLLNKGAEVTKTLRQIIGA